jgi:hypothetical protein
MHKKHNEFQNGAIVYCGIVVTMSFMRFELKGHVMCESDVKSHVERKKRFVYSRDTHFMAKNNAVSDHG